MKNTILMITILVLGLTACKKDNGPEANLSMEDMLCREWKLEKMLLNDVNLEIVNDFSTTKYKKNGVAEFIYNDSVAGEIISVAQWKFVENKKYLEVGGFEKGVRTLLNTLPSYSKIINSDDWSRYEILKLTATEHILLLQQTQDRVFRFEYKAI